MLTMVVYMFKCNYEWTEVDMIQQLRFNARQCILWWDVKYVHDSYNKHKFTLLKLI